jgi:hypothetical protein
MEITYSSVMEILENIALLSAIPVSKNVNDCAF